MRIETHAETASEDDASHSGDVRPVELHSISSCPICYQRSGDVSLRCGHELCVRCLRRWSHNCPMCRSDAHLDFVDETFVESYQENLTKFRALSDDYECRLGVFACASRDGMTVMQYKS